MFWGTKRKQFVIRKANTYIQEDAFTSVNYLEKKGQLGYLGMWGGEYNDQTQFITCIISPQLETRSQVNEKVSLIFKEEKYSIFSTNDY